MNGPQRHKITLDFDIYILNLFFVILVNQIYDFIVPHCPKCETIDHIEVEHASLQTADMNYKYTQIERTSKKFGLLMVCDHL